VDVTTPTRQKHALRLDIQGMRALALLIILAYHAHAPLPGGFTALDLFFVISGFVIVQMLNREHERTGTVDLRRFYVRRFRRLTPALGVTISLVVVIAIFLQSPFGAQQTTSATAAGGMLLTANAVIASTTGNYFALAAEQNPLLHIWSLSTEEQFYLIFPSLLVLAWLGARRRRWSSRMGVTVLVSALALTSFLLAVATSGPQMRWPWTAILGYYGAAGRAWEFAVGALLGIFATRFARMPARVAGVLAIGGVFVIAAGVIGLRSTVAYPGWATLIPVAGASAIIAAGCSRQTAVSRGLSSRPMVFVGDMSYSWYLWHWPLIVFAISLWPQRPFLAPVLAVTVSFIPAWLTYRFVEVPIRSRSTSQGQRNGALFIASFGTPLILSALLAYGAQHTWWQEWKQPSRYTDALAYSCHDAPYDPVTCTWKSQNARGTVFLVGDSTALALSDGVVTADRALGLHTSVSTHSQCPFIAEGHVQFPDGADACAAWQQSTLDTLLRVKPDIVVISNRPYVNGMTSGVQLTDKHQTVVTGPDSVTVWKAALDDTVSTLRRAGIQVVIAEAPPETRYDVPPTGLMQRGRIRATRAEALDRRRISFSADDNVARDIPGTYVFDPLPYLCGPEICPDANAGDALYADARHLSVAGSVRLAGPIKNFLASILPRTQL